MRTTTAWRLALLFALTAAFAACTTTGLPEPETPYLAVRGLRLMGESGAVSRSVVHAYVIWRKPGDTARVSEYMGSINHGMSTSWRTGDETYRVIRGRDALAAIARVERTHVTIPRPMSESRSLTGYVLWPGPNSNTYAALLCRYARISVDLPPSAIGKDWPDAIPYLFGFHASTTGLGFQLDAGIVGVQVGLIEGVQLHVLGSSIGVAFWPPALVLPILGRVGFQP